MLQVEMKSTGSPDVLYLSEGSIPEPKANEVLIEVYACGVNRPDISQREGNYPPPPDASPILGLEVAGKVVKAPASSRFKPGDKVCALVHGGGYAEFCVAPESQCLPVPEGLSMEEAAGIPETFFTVWANVFQIGRLKPGEKFLVHGGTSGIGTTAIQLAGAFGAEVYATAGSDDKCEFCNKLGAKKSVNYKTQSFKEELSDLNLILDMVGGNYTEMNLDVLGTEGRLVQIATQKGSHVNINLFKIMQKRLTVSGSTMRPRSIEDKQKIAQELELQVWPLLQQKKVRVIVNKIFDLKDVTAAHHYMDSGQHIGKVILKVRD